MHKWKWDGTWGLARPHNHTNGPIWGPYGPLLEAGWIPTPLAFGYDLFWIAFFIATGAAVSIILEGYGFKTFYRGIVGVIGSLFANFFASTTQTAYGFWQIEKMCEVIPTHLNHWEGSANPINAVE